ncbi:MAG: DUF2059 domain-containing protein [Bacteroidota bacterium]
MKNTMILWGKWALSLSLIFSFPTLLSAQEYKAEVSFELNEFDTDSAEEKFEIISNELQVFQRQLEKLYAKVSFETDLDGKKELGIEEISYIMQKATNQFLAQNPQVIIDPVKHFIESYSLKELRELSAFYQSELGQKYLQTEKYLYEELMEARKELEEIKQSIYEGEKGGKKKKKKRK